MIAFHSLSEFLDAISVAARGSELRHTNDVADFRERAPGKMLQVDDLSRGFRYGTQQHRNLSCVEQPIAAIIGGGEIWVIINRIRCPSIPPPRDIHRCSARNRQEPCPGISDLGKPATLLRDPYEYVLHNVGRIVLRTGPPQGEAVDLRCRNVVQLIKGHKTARGEVGEEIAPVLVGTAGGPFTLV